MSLAKYLIFMTIATLLCWGAFLVVIYSVDPFSTVTLGIFLFYVSLFFALAGTISILGFIVRYIFNKKQFINQQVMISFRQSILLSILVIVALYLQSNNLIAWWNLLILIVILIGIEFYFLSMRANVNSAK